MDNPTPVPAPDSSVSSPSPDHPSEKPVKKDKKQVDKSMRMLYIIVISLGVIALGLVSFIIYSEVVLKEEPKASNQDDDGLSEEETDETADVEEEEGEEESEETDTETATAFAGTYITASLPEGWSVVEYEDGDGSDMLTDSVTFTGLTGLEVVSPGEGVIFSLKAVYGIGGVEACEDYFQFADNDTDYYNQIVADSAVHGITPTIVDYSTTDYTEFTFMGLSVRRVGQKLFWDTVEDATYFQAACSLSYSAWNLEGVSFTADGMDSSSYMWDINDSADEAILLELDSILDSMSEV